MSRFLVTGAAGFIGRHLCGYLRNRKHEVRALIRRPEEGPWDQAFCCDLGSAPLPDGLMDGVDGIFHLANIAHTDLTGKEAECYWVVNVAGTEDLLTAAANANVDRFIYFSSVKAVADPGEECVDETWEPVPNDLYGYSKRMAEQRVLAAGVKTGMHVCNLRPALVYGPGVKGNLFRMLQTVKRGRFPSLPDFGNRRSMVSLDDLITAAWLAMENPKANGRTYIVEDGQGYSTRMLYEAMCKEFGVPVSRWHIPEHMLCMGAVIGDWTGKLFKRNMPLNSAVLSRLMGSACYRSDRIRNELGWRPQKTFLDVLPCMVDKAKGCR